MECEDCEGGKEKFIGYLPLICPQSKEAWSAWKENNLATPQGVKRSDIANRYRGKRSLSANQTTFSAKAREKN